MTIRKYFEKPKLLMRIFIINMSLIAIFIIFILFLLWHYLSSQALKNEIAFNMSAISGIENYIGNQEKNLLNILKVAYQTSSNVRSDVFSFLSGNGAESQEKRTMLSYISRVYGNQQETSAIAVYAPGSNLVYIAQGIYGALYNADESAFTPLKQTYQEGSYSKNVTIVPSPLYPDYQNYRSYALLYPINSYSNYTVTGSIEIDYRVDGITNFLNIYYEEVKGDFLVLNLEGQILYDSTGYYYDEMSFNHDTEYLETLLNINSSGEKLILDGKSYYVNCIQSPNMGILVVGMIPTKEAMAGMYTIAFSALVMTMLLFTAMGLISFRVTNFRSRQLTEIQTTMEKAVEGQMQAFIDTHGVYHDELTDISNSYNQMLRELNEYIEKVYVSELQRQEYMLLALQAQINPHFLYNTFEAIRMKAIIDGNTDISDMTFLMSHIFKNSIKGKGILTIGTELENCEYYLRLHKIRFKEQLHYKIENDKEIYGYAIVQYALQTLIENYILHGFDNSRMDNMIWVKGIKEGDFIYIVLIDNGNGMAAEEVERVRAGFVEHDLKQGKSLGLSNVYHRMKIIYKEDFFMEIESAERKGTTVSLRFKALRCEEEMEDYVKGFDCR